MPSTWRCAANSKRTDFQCCSRSLPALGGDALDSAVGEFESAPLAFLAVAKEIAMWHHEKWDGSGYPDGLAGDAIPIPARLMALADVFDALASRRIYKGDAVRMRPSI
jgi:putative two-component system response regulator